MNDTTEELLYGIPSHVDYTDFAYELDLEDVQKERIFAVEKLLYSDSFTTNFEAAFLLSNWGIESGYKKLIAYLDNEKALENQGFDAHRLHGYNIIYEQILNGILGYKAVCSDNKHPNIYKEVFEPTSRLIKLANDKPFAIDLLYRNLDYTKELDYLPIIKNHVSELINKKDDKTNYWKIHDGLKYILKNDPEWTTNFMRTKKLRLKEFGLEDFEKETVFKKIINLFRK